MAAMSDLTFTLTEALMLAGAAVMLALLVHGWVLARRARPLDAAPAPDAPPSELGLEAPVEPGFGPVQGAATSATGAQALSDTLPAAARMAPRRPSLRLDSLIDVLATLHIDAPVAGEAVLLHLPATRRAGSKPFAIEGLNADTGEWEAPSAGQRYGEFQAGLQMANRSGALSEIEYSEWVQKVQAFADGIGAMADFPDMLEAVAQGRELDHFASQHDAQMSFKLRAKGAAWTLGYLEQVAKKLGMVPGGLPGRLNLPSSEDGEPPLLWLQVDAQAVLGDEGQGVSLREAALMFDVAQTPEALEPFAALQELARRLCRELDAELVDEAARPIGPHAFAAIHEQLGTLYKALASRDLPAGCVAARRLFS